MKNKLWLGFGAAAVLLLSLCTPVVPTLRADVPTLQSSSNLQAQGTSSSCVVAPGSTGSCVVLHCPAGQSGAVLYVPSGTSIAGTVTVYTAPDVAGAPGVYGNPAWSYLPGGTTSTQSLTSFPGKLYVSLGAEQWIEAVFTTASSGNASATLTCSGSIAFNHGGGGGSPGPPGPNTVVTTSPGLTATETTSSPATYQVAFNGFGNCLGLVTAQIAVTGPGCTPPPLPLSVLNGGTGTSAPSPVPSGCISITGTWPSQTIGCLTPSPVPSANLLTNLTCSGLVACSPSAGPTPAVAVATPHATNTGCGVQTITYPLFALDTTACSGGGGPTILVSPAPSAPITVATPTAGTFVLDCPACITTDPTASPIPPVNCIETNGSSKAHGAGGPCVILQTSSPQPGWSPQPGGIALQKGIYIGPMSEGATPFPSPWPSNIPNAVVLYDGGRSCENNDFTDWGNTGSTVNGITGQAFAIECHNEFGSPFFAIDGAGNFGAKDFYSSGSMHVTLNHGMAFEGISSTDKDCTLAVGSNNNGATMVSSGGVCSIALPSSGASPFSSACLDTNYFLVGCSANTQNSGEVTCSVVSAQSCTATVSVRSGAKCQATMNSTGTTGTTLANLSPPAVSNESGGSVTFTLQVVVPATATLAANYWCP